MGKDGIFNEWSWNNWLAIWEKRSTPITIYQKKIQMDQRLNVKSKTVKLLEREMSKIFITLEWKRLFQPWIRNPKAIDEKIDKFDSAFLKFFFFTWQRIPGVKSEQQKQINKQTNKMADCKEIFTSQIRNKLLLLKMPLQFYGVNLLWDVILLNKRETWGGLMLQEGMGLCKPIRVGGQGFHQNGDPERPNLSIFQGNPQNYILM